MAIEHSLRFADTSSLDEVCVWLLEEDELTRQPGTRGPTFACTGLWIYVTEVSELGQTVCEEAFGFRPTINMCFRLDKSELHEAGMESFLRVCLSMLHRIRGNLVLLQHSEQAWLQRSDGELLLHDRQAQYSEDFWDSRLTDLLEKQEIPFSRTPLTSL